MPDDRSNVVLITTDQQRFDTIQALGHDHMETPNLDRLVEEGVTFTDCHITAPSCAPSRASLFTGYYPHTTGIYRNGDRWRHGWIEELSAAGYYTLNVGKMHTAPYDTPMGFDERHEVENKDRYLAPVPAGEPPLPGEKYYLDEWDKALLARGYSKQQREFYRQWDDYEERLGAFEWELPEELHPDVFVGERTIEWLDAMPKLEQPLFLTVGFPGPHLPYDPVPRWAEVYRKSRPSASGLDPEAVHAEHSRDGILQGTAFMTMVRTDEWKLVHFVDHDEGQLFDLENDPDETENLWDDPDAQAKQQELLDRLLEWRIESGLEAGDWAAEFR